MIKSRFRRPTSKSTMTVLWPRRARPVPMAALVVVLPTPPLPEVTTMILAKVIHPKIENRDLPPGFGVRIARLVLENSRQYPLKAGDVQHVAGEADAYRFSPERSRRRSSATLYWPAMETISAASCWQKIRAEVSPLMPARRDREADRRHGCCHRREVPHRGLPAPAQ